MKQQVTEYNVLLDADLKNLVLVINDAMIVGWQPIGGVFCSNVTGHYMQAVVRSKKQNDD